MPATARRSASPAQIRFLSTLVAERGDEALRLAGLLGEARTAIGGGPIARDLIDRVIAVRPASRVRNLSTPSEAEREGEVVPAPTRTNRAGRMLSAGGVEATVTLADGRHVTLRVKTNRQSGRGYANCAPTETGARTNIYVLGRKIGWIRVDGAEWRLVLRTRQDFLVDAVHALLNYCAGLPGDLTVREATRCGRCLRPLTDPVSIQRGIGPECFGRDTGSRHASVETPPAVSAGRMTVQEHADAAEARMNEAVAVAEREEHIRAYTAEMNEEAATVEPVRHGVSARNVERARNLIAEALDSYLDSDEQRDFAMNIFNQLAAR